MNFKALIVSMMAVAAIGTGCGPAEELTPPPGEQQQAAGDASNLDALINPVNANGECCKAWCNNGAYWLRIGNKEKTQGCAAWADDACRRRGYYLYDAEWGSCSEGGVLWL